MSRRTEPDVEELRPSRWLGILFALSLGAFIEILAVHLLPLGPVNLLNNVVYVGLALSVALGYRRFVRRALIARRRDRARRERPAQPRV